MASNGSDPALAFEQYVSQAENALATEVASMRVLLENERDLERRLNEQLRMSALRRKRLEKVIGLLAGEDEKPKPKAKKPNEWRVSDAKVEQIWQIMRAYPEPFTASGLAESTPRLGAETVRRVVDLLRERELLRIVGSSRGGGKLLAVMPGAENFDSMGRSNADA